MIKKSTKKYARLSLVCAWFMRYAAAQKINKMSIPSLLYMVINAAVIKYKLIPLSTSEKVTRSFLSHSRLFSEKKILH